MPGILDFLRQGTQNLFSNLGRDFNQFNRSFRGPDLIQRANNQVRQQAPQAYQSFRNTQIPVPFLPPQVRRPTFGYGIDEAKKATQQFSQGYFNPETSVRQPRQSFANAAGVYAGGFTPSATVSHAGAGVGIFALGKLSAARKILPAVEESKISSALSGIKNFENFHPSAQMQILTNVRSVAAQHLPQVVASKEMKLLETSDQKQWLNTVGKFLEDRLVNSKNPGVDIGFQAKPLQKVDSFIQGLEKDSQEAMDRMSPAEHRPVPIEINAHDAQVAEVSTLAGNSGKGGFKGFAKDLQNGFSDWVNGRNAAEFKKYETFKKWDNVVNPDKSIMNTFHDTGDKVQNFLGKLETIRKDTNSPVRNFFDTAYKQITGAGYKLGYKTDYFPQLWANPPEEVTQKMGDRMLSLNPSFTFESIIKNYQDGVKAGLTPKYTNVAELMGWYDGQVQRALADKNFFQGLAKSSYLRPASQAPTGWKSLDPDLFPKVKVSFSNAAGRTEYTGVYKAPPELANVINGYLRAPNDKLNGFANIATKLKNFVLENGIPGTGINFHGVNILVRSAMAGDNVAHIPGTGIVKGGTQALYYLINPNAAQREIDSNLERATFAISQGLKLDTEAGVFGQKPGLVGKLFQVPLFQKVIPGLKIKSFNTVYDDLAKHMDSNTAAQEASKIVNNIYGGINWEQFGRSRQTQALLRSIIFAPDFQESNLGLGKGVVKSLLDPGNPLGGQYRNIARNLLYLYTGANLLNKQTSGKWMWQNDPGHNFDVQIGFTDAGQKRYFRPFGTAADFVRIPFDVASSLAKGDTKTLRSTLANRVSAPLAAGARFALNVDEFGRPISGAGDTAINSVAQLAQTLIPQYGSAATRYIAGQQSGEQSIAQAVGLPLRYAGGATTVNEKKVANYLKKQKVPGKEIGNIIQYYKDHGALDKAYTAYNTDIKKGPAFIKSIKSASQSDKVVSRAWTETVQHVKSNPQLTDDEIIQYAKKRLDYYNKEVDKAYKFPAQYVADQAAAKNIQKMSPKAQKTLRNRLRKRR